MGKLVLWRYPKQSFFVGKTVKITVLSHDDEDGVRILVDAPDTVVVMREELVNEDVARRSKPVDSREKP